MQELDAKTEYEARLAREKLFAQLDPAHAPFAPAVEAKAILFPTNPWLEPDELSALLKAIAASGDTGFFMTLSNPETHSQGGLRSWFVTPDDVRSYLETVSRGRGFEFWTDTAIYVPSGRWGMLRSIDLHTVIGGERQLVETLLDLYPSERPLYEEGMSPLPTKLAPRDQICAFLEWAREPESGLMETLPELLTHVCGSQAIEILAKKCASWGDASQRADEEDGG